MSDWINFVKAFADKYDMSYSEALKAARPYYKKRNMRRKRGVKEEHIIKWQKIY